MSAQENFLLRELHQSREEMMRVLETTTTAVFQYNPVTDEIQQNDYTAGGSSSVHHTEGSFTPRQIKHCTRPRRRERGVIQYCIDNALLFLYTSAGRIPSGVLPDPHTVSATKLQWNS